MVLKGLVAIRLAGEGQLAGKRNVYIWHYFSGVSKYLKLTVVLDSRLSSPSGLARPNTS